MNKTPNLTQITDKLIAQECENGDIILYAKNFKDNKFYILDVYEVQK